MAVVSWGMVLCRMELEAEPTFLRDWSNPADRLRIRDVEAPGSLIRWAPDS